MTYKVTKQYARGADTFCADFNNVKDAKAYIAEKLGAEVAMGVKVTYQIVEFGDVIESFDATNIPANPNAQSSVDDSSSSGGRGAGSRPTPLSTVPRPPGMPQTWGSDDKEEEK